MELYTVDRLSKLASGLTCSLIEHENINPRELVHLINEMCPGGVSQHGLTYLVAGPGNADIATNGDIEILFEWVRRANHPSKPSRFQCIFAVDNLDAAENFRREFHGADAPVYRVVSEQAFRADMRLLDGRTSPAVRSWFANLYWQGLPHPVSPPYWEWLVPCPVVIGDQVR